MEFEVDAIVCGDCLQVIAKMPNDCVDLLVADPPYDLGFWDWVEGWIEELPRILKPDASLYIFCGIGEKSDSLSRMLPIIKEYFMFKNLITWKKQRGYGTQRNWMYTREEVIFAVNGPKYTFHPQYTDEFSPVFTTGFLGGMSQKYRKSKYKRASNVWTDIQELTKGVGNSPEWMGVNSAQKPENLLERIILASSNKGDLVFDPFVGTGTTTAVAARLDRHYFACDIDPDMVDLAVKRTLNPEIPAGLMRPKDEVESMERLF